MRFCLVALVVLVVGTLAGSASAGVVVGGTETFTVGSADWGVGGPDGWQLDWIPDWSNNTHREFFGSVGQILTPAGSEPYNHKNTKGQPDPGSHTADGTGTLAVQHMACWSGAAPPTPDPPYTSNQMQYIEFTSVPGVTYELSAFVNTVYIQHGSAYDGKHPKIVDHGDPPMPAQFPNLEIGLKNGSQDPSDLTTSYTQVTGLIDNMEGGVPNPNAWVPTPTVSLEATGDTMTIILKMQVPDISTSGVDPADNWTWDLDARWDDVTLTPEPATLGLLGLGFMFVMRRRRS